MLKKVFFLSLLKPEKKMKKCFFITALAVLISSCSAPIVEEYSLNEKMLIQSNFTAMCLRLKKDVTAKLGSLAFLEYGSNEYELALKKANISSELYYKSCNS